MEVSCLTRMSSCPVRCVHFSHYPRTLSMKSFKDMTISGGVWVKWHRYLSWLLFLHLLPHLSADIEFTRLWGTQEIWIWGREISRYWMQSHDQFQTFPGEKRLRGDLISLYNNLKGSDMGVGLFSQVSSDRMRENSPKLHQGRSSIETGCPGKSPTLQVFKTRGDVALRDMVSG